MPAKNPQRSSRVTAPEPLSPGAPLSETAARLAHAAPAAAPTPAVKANLLARIRASQTPAVAPVAPGWRFESVGEAAGWVALPFPGVRVKQLSADPKRDVLQLIFEIAPGARFPDHVHTFGDEGIVLSGDVVTGGRLLRAGDYYFAGPGTKHTDIVSPNGCTALVSMPLTAWNRWRAELATAAKH